MIQLAIQIAGLVEENRYSSEEEAVNPLNLLDEVSVLKNRVVFANLPAYIYPMSFKEIRKLNEVSNEYSAIRASVTREVTITDK